jgi:hypothetical protein
MYLSLFDCEDYSDITIKTEAREYKCHTIILCHTSEYFKAMCGPRSPWLESKQSVVELKEDDPKAAEAILRHLYKFEYDEIRESIGGFDITTRLNVVLAAQKYLLPEFEEIALHRVEHALARIETDYGKTGDITQIWDFVRLLSSHVKYQVNFTNWFDKLWKEHLAKLFKLKELSYMAGNRRGGGCTCSVYHDART